MDRAADNHYPTLDLAAICALQVPAAADAVLFLWATTPMLPEALTVMSAWGFTYRSHCIWAKDRAGTGYWFRSQHELLLVGTRGELPAPAPGEQYASVIEAPVGEHSAKPPAFVEMIEEMFPSLPALEMFARMPRLGWHVWGNETA
jgi:N6-adenosine-specific RNA methylase IME4